MFDLAGAASNAGMTADESDELLTVYFGGTTRPGDPALAPAMQCASLLREAMWSMVSELYLSAPGSRLRRPTPPKTSIASTGALDAYRTTYGKLSNYDPAQPRRRSSSSAAASSAARQPITSPATTRPT
jgi:hypothetical protein